MSVIRGAADQICSVGDVRPVARIGRERWRNEAVVLVAFAARGRIGVGVVRPSRRLQADYAPLNRRRRAATTCQYWR